MKLPHAVITALKLGMAASSMAPLGCQPGDANASIPVKPATPAPTPTPVATPPAVAPAAPPPAEAQPVSQAAPVRVVRLKPVKVLRPGLGNPIRGVLSSPERKRRDPCPACGMG